MAEQTVIMDENAVGRTLSRLAHEIIETNPEEKTVCLVGIKRRGVPLAKMLAEKITSFSDIKVFLGELDITLYRDDLHEKADQPRLIKADLGFAVKGKTIVLVDDVIYTGRTARAAMEAVIRLGRPARIRLAVMVDRGHRELPIDPEYVGKNVPTAREEQICVLTPQFDGQWGIHLRKQA